MAWMAGEWRLIQALIKAAVVTNSFQTAAKRSSVQIPGLVTEIFLLSQI
jgi:hypothetical protein